MIDHAQLKAEILTDPQGLGYAALWESGDDLGLLAILNDKALGGTISRLYITAAELQGAMDPTEFAAFSAAFIARWQCFLMVTMASLPIATGNLKQQLLAMFPNSAGTANSRANLIALQSRAGSRIEALFGDGIVASGEDIIKARVA